MSIQDRVKQLKCDFIKFVEDKLLKIVKGESKGNTVNFELEFLIIKIAELEAEIKRIKELLNDDCK